MTKKRRRKPFLLTSQNELMTSHDGHLGPPSWISRFLQNLERQSKLIKTSKNHEINMKMIYICENYKEKGKF